MHYFKGSNKFVIVVICLLFIPIGSVKGEESRINPADQCMFGLFILGQKNQPINTFREFSDRVAQVRDKGLEITGLGVYLGVNVQEFVGPKKDPDLDRAFWDILDNLGKATACKPPCKKPRRCHHELKKCVESKKFSDEEPSFKLTQ